jgi:thiamine pyrophosphokinase
LLDFKPHSLFYCPMFLIVSGGEAPGNAFVRERADEARMVIAADRGAQYCLEAGVTPDLVVGDMDSLPRALYRRIEAAGIPMKVHPPMKDETDTRLALDEAIALGARKVEIIAATGDRFDHTLANVHLLYAAHILKVDACLSSPRFRIFLVEGEATLAGARGGTVSFLPLTMEARGVTLTGFRWPLADALMKVGDPYGVSNIATEDDARITVKEGVLIAVVEGPVHGHKG